MIRDQRGAVLVEGLVAVMPVLLAFGGTLQYADAAAASLIVQRAAGAAVRAAVVVLPDDPAYYGGAPVNVYGGTRQQVIELASELTLAAKSGLSAGNLASQERATPIPMRVTGTFSGNAPITAHVAASYTCFPGLLGLACGLDRLIPMSASATLPYQGADFEYAGAASSGAGSW